MGFDRDLGGLYLATNDIEEIRISWEAVVPAPRNSPYPMGTLLGHGNTNFA